MRYGMLLLHRGMDHLNLPKPIIHKHLEVQDMRVFNLQSMKLACDLAVEPMPTYTTQTAGQFKVDYKCFRITWCMGFETLRIEGRSRVKLLFKTKVCKTFQN